jgi:protein O-mannosyl-transferase
VFTAIKKIIKENSLLAIALVVCIFVYAKFIFFGHISWDDPEMVFKNKFVKTFAVKELVTNHFVGNYIPIAMLTHALAWLLFEDNDGAHHVINILLHLLNGCLIYTLGKQLFKNESIALISTILFLLHPMQMESVGWISELKNVLSTTFYLAGLLSYLKYSQTFTKKHYVFTIMFFLLGCLSKSSVVVFPLSLICLDIVLQNKISIKFFINKIPLFIISIAFGLINIKTQTADLFINYAHAFPYYQRIGFAGYALVKYLVLFLFPVNLSVIYPYPTHTNTAIIIGYLVITLLAIALFFSYKNKRYNYLAVVLFTLVNLILVLQFIPFGEVLYADRYMYVPIIGFGWLVGHTIIQIKIPIKTLSIALLCLLSFSSYLRANVWRSGITLYEDILRNFPNSFVALNSVGVEYMMRDNNDKALYYLNKSIQVAPQNYKGYYNRGLLYLKNQKNELALKSFNQALDIYDYPKARIGRGSAYHLLGNIPKAMEEANYILARDKNNPKAHFILGNCYNDLNKLDDALREYNACIEFSGDEADFYFKRAIVFGKKQNFTASIRDMDMCLSLSPDYYEAYYWRGVAKTNLKQNACEDFKVAAQKNYEPAIDAFNKYCQ